MKKYIAEIIGTFWLVFASLCAAHFAAGIEGVGIGWLGVSIAFGLTIVTMAYAIGHVSGCHLNPAVSLGLLLAGRFDAKDFVPYVIAQVIGATLGAAGIYLIASGHPAVDGEAFWSPLGICNGFGDAEGFGSPQGYSLMAVFIAEVIFTAIFLIVILGSTSERAPAGFAPIAIGTCLTLIHLCMIPVSNCSVNPARSIGTAIFGGGEALGQVWLFIVAPLIGGALGAIIHKVIGDKN